MSDQWSNPCRTVTSDEVKHLQEHGWVKLEGFVDPEVIQAMLALAREAMGDDADSNPIPAGFEQAAADGKFGLDYFNAHLSFGLSNPVLRPLLLEVGKNAKALQRRATADGHGVDVRYYSDFFVPKLPNSKMSLHKGNGPTAFHQDFITFAVDRSGGMSFWFPLESYGPDAGTMSFVNGSHRAGVLGDYTAYGDGDALDVFPELRELEMSDPMTYDVGDITVHTHLTVHGVRSEHDGQTTLGLPRRDPAGRRLLERFAVPELQLERHEAVETLGRRSLPRHQLSETAPTRDRRSHRTPEGHDDDDLLAPIPRVHAGVLAGPGSRCRHRHLGAAPLESGRSSGSTACRSRTVVTGVSPPTSRRSRRRSPMPAISRSSWSARTTMNPGSFATCSSRGEFGLHHMAQVCRDYESERDAYLEHGAELAFEGEVRSEPHVLGRHDPVPRLHDRAARAERDARRVVRPHAEGRRVLGRDRPHRRSANIRRRPIAKRWGERGRIYLP